mmetsp:Transcript_17241/g.33833  ORF Transcript_17241/g.33833 Transcript_17241/m.33833 type:complete len:1065 (+) Transcript_17241:99-3293(+)
MAHAAAATTASAATSNTTNRITASRAHSQHAMQSAGKAETRDASSSSQNDPAGATSTASAPISGTTHDNKNGAVSSSPSSLHSSSSVNSVPCEATQGPDVATPSHPSALDAATSLAGFEVAGAGSSGSSTIPSELGSQAQFSSSTEVSSANGFQTSSTANSFHSTESSTVRNMPLGMGSESAADLASSTASTSLVTPTLMTSTTTRRSTRAAAITGKRESSRRRLSPSSCTQSTASDSLRLQVQGRTEPALIETSIMESMESRDDEYEGLVIKPSKPRRRVNKSTKKNTQQTTRSRAVTRNKRNTKPFQDSDVEEDQYDEHHFNDDDDKDEDYQEAKASKKRLSPAPTGRTNASRRKTTTTKSKQNKQNLRKTQTADAGPQRSPKRRRPSSAATGTRKSRRSMSQSKSPRSHASESFTRDSMLHEHVEIYLGDDKKRLAVVEKEGDVFVLLRFKDDDSLFWEVKSACHLVEDSRAGSEQGTLPVSPQSLSMKSFEDHTPAIVATSAAESRAARAKRREGTRVDYVMQRDVDQTCKDVASERHRIVINRTGQTTGLNNEGTKLPEGGLPISSVRYFCTEMLPNRVADTLFKIMRNNMKPMYEDSQGSNRWDDAEKQQELLCSAGMNFFVVYSDEIKVAPRCADEDDPFMVCLDVLKGVVDQVVENSEGCSPLTSQNLPSSGIVRKDSTVETDGVVDSFSTSVSAENDQKELKIGAEAGQDTTTKDTHNPKNIIGFVAFKTYYEMNKWPILYIHELQLVPEARQFRIGAYLMGHLEDVAYRLKTALLMLTVQKSNEKARNFYSKGGFSIDEACPSLCYQNEDVTYRIMSKVLKKDILKHKCHVCGSAVGYRYPESLQIHNCKHHHEKWPYPCRKCPLGTVKKEQLDRHMYLHGEYKGAPRKGDLTMFVFPANAFDCRDTGGGSCGSSTTSSTTTKKIPRAVDILCQRVTILENGLEGMVIKVVRNKYVVRLDGDSSILRSLRRSEFDLQLPITPDALHRCCSESSSDSDSTKVVAHFDASKLLPPVSGRKEKHPDHDYAIQLHYETNCRRQSRRRGSSGKSSSSSS